MANRNDDVLSGTSLLDLGLEEITAPDDGSEQWAAAGRALVDRMDASLRTQREAEAARRGRERPLSERYEYQFDEPAEQAADGPEPGW